MAKIDLLSLQPQKVSQDISSYSLLVYGPVKVGKTTFIQELYGDRVLNIMTEKRFKAIDGGMFQYISSWSDFRSVLRQLARPELKERFDVISIDSVENLFDYLQKFVLQKYDEEEFGEKNLFGKDWQYLKKSWDEGLYAIEQLGYTPVFVSHSIQRTVKVPVLEMSDSDKQQLGTLGAKKVRDAKTQQDYAEYDKYVPDLKDKYLATINKMVDNIMFIDTATTSEGKEERIIHLRGSLQWEAGSTFKDVPDIIPLSADVYKDVVAKAVGSAENKTDARKADSDIVTENEDFEDVKNKALQQAQKLATEGKLDVVNGIIQSVLGADAKLSQLKPKQQELAEDILGQLLEVK